MDPHQPFPFDWSNHGPTYNQQVHDLLEEPPQLASISSSFQAPLQSHFQSGIANDFPPNNGISMEGIEVEEQPVPLKTMARPKTKSSGGVKSENPNWNAYKDAIRSLYIDKKKTLSETMAAMKNDHSFKAT